MANPLIMLPHINDRQINRRIPTQLNYVTQPVDVLRTKIQIFLYLKQTIQLLIKPQPDERSGSSKESKHANDINPISRPQTVIHSWVCGQSYQLPSVNVELILCNQRVNKKMCVRYVMIDPEFLIIIEPDFSV